MNKYVKRAIFIVSIVFIVITFILIYIYVDNETVKALSMGLLSSVIASMLFYIISEIALSAKSEDHNKLEQMIDVLSKIYTKGIISIQRRDEYNYSFWLTFSNKANKEISLCGRTLNRWLDTNLKNDFRNTLLRVIKCGGTVNLVILNNPSEIMEQREKEELYLFLRNEIFSSCVYKKDNKYEIIDNLNFNIFGLNYLPYLYSTNGFELIVAPYFLHTDNSNNIMFVLANDSEYALRYISDFKSVLRNATKISWLNDYCNELNQVGNLIIERQVIYSSNNYASQHWGYEESYKYLLEVDSKLVEAAFYQHYGDNSKREFIKSVIELPSSCGCPMKCKFCASSNLSTSKKLSHSEIVAIYKYIYEKKKPNGELHVSFAGIGDLYYTLEEVIDSIKQISTINTHIQYTVSSCYWTINMLKSVNSLSKSVRIRAIQFTYVGIKDTYNMLIPNKPKERSNLSDIIAFIKNNKIGIIRINYLSISGVNDSPVDIETFIDRFKSLKDLVVVRVSKLNATSATKRNNLTCVSNEKMTEIATILKSKGFNSYVFYPEEDDNMNCGQLISDTAGITISS